MERPVCPDELARSLNFDLSPVRPWEWAHLVDLDQWHEAVQLRNAYAAGIVDARDEAEGEAWLRQGRAGQAG